MAWSAPRTWVAGDVLTAAQLNQDVRDNVTFLGATVGATVATSETTSSTSYTDLATSGPSVTLTTGTKAIVILTCRMSTAAAGTQYWVSYAVSGASTIASADSKALRTEIATVGQDIATSWVDYVSGLTAGSNTFKMQYRVNASTGTFRERRIAVINIPS